MMVYGLGPSRVPNAVCAKYPKLAHGGAREGHLRGGGSQCLPYIAKKKGAGTILCQFPKYISRTQFRKFSINTLMTTWTEISMWVGFAWRDGHYHPLDLDHHHHHHYQQQHHHHHHHHYRQQQLRYRCEFLGWVCAHGDADHIVGVWGDGQRYQCMNPSGLWPVFILKRTRGFQIRRWTFLINFVYKRGDDTSKVGLCQYAPCMFIWRRRVLKIYLCLQDL